MYLTSFGPPSALIPRIILPPLPDILVSVMKIALIGLKPPPLALFFTLCLTGFVFACLLPIAYTRICLEIPATINTSLLNFVCLFHTNILKADFAEKDEK